VSSTPARPAPNAAKIVLFIVGAIALIVGVVLFAADVYSGGNGIFYFAYNGFAGHLAQLILFLLGCVLIAVGIVLLVLAVRAPSGAELMLRAHDARANSIAARADEIAQWEEAYALAHDGQRPPASFMPPVSLAADSPQRTNTFAVLSLIFAILGSVLGIVFGHVALAQIRRTGDSGRGLAVAGLVIGYLLLAVGVILVIVGLVALRGAA
jgi:uncharacterized membrane protein